MANSLPASNVLHEVDIPLYAQREIWTDQVNVPSSFYILSPVEVTGGNTMLQWILYRILNSAHLCLGKISNPCVWIDASYLHYSMSKIGSNAADLAEPEWNFLTSIYVCPHESDDETILSRH